MKFLPIEAEEKLNARFSNHAECSDVLSIFTAHYKKVGFKKPWIAYFVTDESDNIVGGAGYKGKPVGGKVEISYGTFKGYEGEGIGTEICRMMVSLALKEDSSIIVSARTLSNNVASIKILEKNGFINMGFVTDPEDGEVLEWVYSPTTPLSSL
jgi:RimJ/RimL family protein N-acetyltransferase